MVDLVGLLHPDTAGALDLSTWVDVRLLVARDRGKRRDAGVGLDREITGFLGQADRSRLGMVTSLPRLGPDLRRRAVPTRTVPNGIQFANPAETRRSPPAYE